MNILWLNGLLLIAAPFVGSFIALTAHRLPRRESIVTGRSRCDLCGHNLALYDLLPLVSFLWLKGRCGYCDAKIPLRYLLIELAALIAALWALLIVPADTAWISIALGWTLLLLSAVDATSLRLPDFATLPLIPAGLLAVFYFDPQALTWHLIAAVAGYLSIQIVALLYLYLRKRPGIGAGDAKLFAAGGAWLGLYGLPSMLLIAAVSALLFAVVRSMLSEKEEHRLTQTMALPFGSFLALGFWLVWLYGPLQFAD